MEPVAVATFLLALLVLVTRTPMLIWPTATLEVFERLLASPANVRWIGAVCGLLGAALVFTASGAHVQSPNAAPWLIGFGWLFVAATFWFVFFPRSYSNFTLGILGGMDSAGMRVIGALGTVGGLLLAWLAWEVRY
jgi:hypothetical protein